MIAQVECKNTSEIKPLFYEDPIRLQDKFYLLDKIRRKVPNFILKQKYDVGIENRRSPEVDKVLKKLFKRRAFEGCNFVTVIINK